MGRHFGRGGSESCMQKFLNSKTLWTETRYMECLYTAVSTRNERRWSIDVVLISLTALGSRRIVPLAVRALRVDPV